MKVTLPEHSRDITLYQYQKYAELLSRTDLNETQFEQRKIQIFTGIKPDEYIGLTQKDKDEILSQIETALNTPFEFEQRFTMEGIEFGFIPNLDKITAGEYFDLCKCGTDVNELHKLMAILFRPIVKKTRYGDYSIEDYKGTSDWSEAMKLTPMSVVNGALFFFLNLSTELTNYTQSLKLKEQAKEQPQKDILKNGGGMRLSTD